MIDIEGSSSEIAASRGRDGLGSGSCEFVMQTGSSSRQWFGWILEMLEAAAAKVLKEDRRRGRPDSNLVVLDALFIRRGRP
jgi:hypothetical protein